MPILVKDFTWRQTDDLVVIRVPLKFAVPNNVDVLLTEKYVKAFCSPFFFEVFLWGGVDVVKSKVTLAKGEALFELFKLNPGQWTDLSLDLDKVEKAAIRSKAIDEEHGREKEKKESVKEIKYKRQSDCVKYQMQFEEEQREKVDQRKKLEKTAAVHNLMEWKAKETDDLEPKWKKTGEKLWAVEECQIFERGDPVTKDQPTKPPPPPPAPPRKFGHIACDFTFRAFPTPSRESMLKEEEEWLKKQAEARRHIGFVAEDLRPEENDLNWLLDKGKSFASAGNHLGAVSALTHAISNWPNVPELYVERSHSHVALKNWRRVLYDTSTALDLCRPPVDDNCDYRYWAFVNRGKALLALERGKSATAEFVEAMELNPFAPELESLMRRAEDAVGTVEQPTKYIEAEDLAN